ncbi:MAG: PHP domain-containing protein, partial [Malacoplasma sp.]|nr:PHP domain-containing protein [Malacoplasma sp.]
LDTIFEHKKNINEKIKEKNLLKQNIDAKKEKQSDSTFQYKFKKNISGETTKLSDLFFEMKTANVEGEIFKIESILTKNGFQIFKFYITDYTDSVLLKALFGKKINQEVLDKLKVGTWIRSKISIQTDLYENNEITGLIEEISVIDKPKKFQRFDNEKIKRTELINHTNMTAFEGLINIKEIFKFSKEMGYKAVAITDKFNCQNFPEFYNESKKYPEIKTIYGVQMDKTTKDIMVVKNPISTNLNEACYVLFDIETTGLSPYYDKIIEFGAIKYHRGVIVDRIQFFIDPEEKINEKIYSLTRISNNELDGAIKIKEALVKIKDFIKDSVLIAHNGIKFDLPFLNCKLEQLNMDLITNTMIDTLQISRAINEQISGHSLGIIARKYKISYNELEAHRADKDAEYLLDVWKKMQELLSFKGINTIQELNEKLQNSFLKSRNRGSLITVYCKSQE